MSKGAANVRSIQAIHEFHGELVRFKEDASIAVSSLQMQINRVLQWLERDRPNYWRRQVQLGHQQVAEARVALTKCRMRRTGDFKPTCYDEQKALERAKKRMELAYKKVEVVRRWIVKARHEVDEFTSRTAHLNRTLDGDVPRMLALLDRLTANLEKYAAVGKSVDSAEATDKPDEDTDSDPQAAHGDKQ